MDTPEFEIESWYPYVAENCYAIKCEGESPAVFGTTCVKYDFKYWFYLFRKLSILMCVGVEIKLNDDV